MMKFSKCLPLVLLGFSLISFAGTPCPDCAQQYGAVLAYAQTTTNDLTSARRSVWSCRGRCNQINTYCLNILSSSNDPTVNSYVRYIISENNELLGQVDTTLTLVESSLSQCEGILTTLDNFSCSCTNSCACVSVLNDILSELYIIETGVIDPLSSLVSSVNSIEYYSSLLSDIYDRLTIKDDEYRMDLNYLSAQLINAVELSDGLSASLANGRFNRFTDYMTNADMGIAYLYTVEYQNMLVNSKSNKTLDKILDALTNLSFSVTNSLSLTNSCCCNYEADLAFISNYLWNIQRKYFDDYRSRFSLDGSRTFPFFGGGDSYTVATNFFGSMRSSDYRTYQAKMAKLGTSYRNYRNLYTNWFDRIEFALYGLAGAWDFVSPEEGSFNASTISNSFSTLLPSTNAFSTVSDVFNITNECNNLVDSFRTFVASFEFQGTSMFSQTLTLCPSFQIGSFDFSGISFEFYDISNVLEAIRFAMRFIWASFFAFMGFGLAAKFFIELGKAISHVFVLLKTLL